MSHNCNPNGKNQHNATHKSTHSYIALLSTILLVVKSSDLTLQEALKKYHSEGITNDKKISVRLLKEYDITMRSAIFFLCLHTAGLYDMLVHTL